MSSPLIYTVKHINKDTGKEEAQYIPNEAQAITGNIVRLKEVPDYNHHVIIDNMYEIKQGKVISDPTQFTVDYNYGIVTFDSSLEGQTKSFTYYGTGYILIDYRRIATMSNGNTIIQTLGDIIDAGRDAITALLSLSAFTVCEDYNNTKFYVPMNKVTLDGSTYQNKVACQGILPTDTSKWLLVAKKGYDGFSSIIPYIFTASSDNTTNITGITNYDPLHDVLEIIDVKYGDTLTENVDYTVANDNLSITLISGNFLNNGEKIKINIYKNLNESTIQQNITDAISAKNNLDSTTSTANTTKTDLQNVISTANTTTYVPRGDVIDDLTHSDINKPLSANQGKVISASLADIAVFAPLPNGIDDTAILQNLLDNNGKVYLGGGTYLVTGLLLNTYNTLVGKGKFNTILKLKNGSTNKNVVQNKSDTTRYCSVQYLTIDGNKSNCTANDNLNGNGIYWNKPFLEARNTFKHLIIQNCCYRGISILSGSCDTLWDDISIHDNNSEGLYTQAPDDKFTNITAYMNGKTGVVFHVGSVQAKNIKSYSNSNNIDRLPNIWLQGVSSGAMLQEIMMSNCFSQDAWGHGFQIDYCKNTVLSSCISSRSSRNGEANVEGSHLYDDFNINNCDNVIMNISAGDWTADAYGKRSSRYGINLTNVTKSFINATVAQRIDSSYESCSTNVQNSEIIVNGIRNNEVVHSFIPIFNNPNNLNLALGYAEQMGEYYKQNDRYIIKCSITLNAISNKADSSPIRVNLPSVQNGSVYVGTGMFTTNPTSVVPKQITVYGYAGGNYMRFIKSDGTYLTEQDLTGTSKLSFSFEYR